MRIVLTGGDQVADAPLANGVDGSGLSLLWGGAAILIAVATAALARRDILG